MEGRASGFEQDNTSTEALEAVMQGGKQGEIRLGCQQNPGEETAAAQTDRWRECAATLLNQRTIACHDSRVRKRI